MKDTEFKILDIMSREIGNPISIRKIKEKINALASANPQSGFADKVAYRRANKKWLQKSSDIALRILDALDSKGWKQARLAQELGVTPQQVSKIVKGHENLKLETIAKIEEILGLELITVLQEDEIVAKKVSYSRYSEFAIPNPDNLDL